MAIKKTGPEQITARSPAAREPLSALVSILGDIAQVTGIEIRYF